MKEAKKKEKDRENEGRDRSIYREKREEGINQNEKE